jgi:nucleoside diphosphate kinase
LSGPIIAVLVSSRGTPEQVIARARKLQGPTDPAKAPEGTLRNLEWDTLEKAIAENRGLENLTHTSDNTAALKAEIDLWIPKS